MTELTPSRSYWFWPSELRTLTEYEFHSLSLLVFLECRKPGDDRDQKGYQQIDPELITEHHDWCWYGQMNFRGSKQMADCHTSVGIGIRLFVENHESTSPAGPDADPEKKPAFTPRLFSV